MNKFLFVFLIAGVMAWSSQSIAQSDAASAPKAVKKAPIKKAPAKKAAAAEKPVIADDDDDDKEQDITASTVTEFHCELGNQVTIYENADDDKHIGLRWHHQVHRLRRIGTSTGANRFENRKAGLVWIGIPAKSMLLDSKKGQQLANECRTAEQAMAQKSSEVEPPKKAAPPKSRKPVKK